MAVSPPPTRRRLRLHRGRRQQRPEASRPFSYDHDVDSPEKHNNNNTSSSSSDDWQPETPDAVPVTTSRTSRTSRVTRAAASSSSVTVSRAASQSPEDDKKSIRLTVKMPSSKLREVTNSGGRTSTASTRRSVNVFADPPIITGPRSSRTQKRLVEVNTSEDEDEDDEDEDAPGENDEDLDADGDLDMDDTPPQPPVSRRQAKATAAAMATPAKDKPLKGVEQKEMELADDDDDDDEELSELDSDAEGEPDDTMADMGEGGMEDDEELDEEDEEDEEDDEEDETDDATPATGSRASTPDLSKLTKRQRGSLGSDFLQLPMEPQVKKHLTAEEHAMRRAEMARRRKNLSEKRNEEEKMDTINRLLKKQAPKRRGRITVTETAAGEGTPDVPAEFEKADPTMIRWTSSRDRCRIGVPEEMFGGPAARLFGEPPAGSESGSRKLVEEV